MSETPNEQGESTVKKPSNPMNPAPIAEDDVFGEITEEGPNYRDVGWLGTVALMMKTQFGLGVLSIPQVFNTLGMIPGVVCLVAISSICTWSAYVIGQFKLRHPGVYGIDDAGDLMFGRVGREVLGVSVCIYWIFTTSSGILGTSTALNAVSSHGACTAVFIAVSAIGSYGLASIRTLGKIQWTAWVGVGCVFVAVIMVTIAVGVQDRPPTAPKTDGAWISDYKLVGNPSFTEAISGVSSIVFAYCGTPGFFPIAAEMRDHSLYTRSVLICQASVTAIYITAGIVIYYYCGSYVSSPALGSAGALIKKISYGIAIPGLVVSSIVVLHFSSKYLFVRILRGSSHLTANSFIHWATWLSCTFAITLSAYLIASGIPIFNDLIALIGALFGTFLSIQPMGCMWLYDNWKGGREQRTVKRMLMVAWNIAVVILGSFLMVAGTYGSISGIIASTKANSGSSAWSCADNSNT